MLVETTTAHRAGRNEMTKKLAKILDDILDREEVVDCLTDVQLHADHTDVNGRCVAALESHITHGGDPRQIYVASAENGIVWMEI